MLAASGVPTWSNSALLAAPELAFCAFSGRAWWLWAARHSQSEAQPLGAPPPPRGFERAASNVAGFTAFDHLGVVLRHAFVVELEPQRDKDVVKLVLAAGHLGSRKAE